MTTTDGTVVPAAPERYAEVVRALYDEAELLDSGQLDAWLGTLAEEVRYRVGVRVTRERASLELPHASFHLDEDAETLGLRVRRLATQYAWAEDPPSRVRHLLTNIRVDEREVGDEVDVHCTLVVLRTRGDDTRPDILSGVRHDVLRQRDGAWELVLREVVLDQATLGTRNLAIMV